MFQALYTLQGTQYRATVMTPQRLPTQRMEKTLTRGSRCLLPICDNTPSLNLNEHIRTLLSTPSTTLPSCWRRRSRYNIQRPHHSCHRIEAATTTTLFSGRCRLRRTRGLSRRLVQRVEACLHSVTTPHSDSPATASTLLA